MSKSVDDGNGSNQPNYDSFTQSLVFPNDVSVAKITATHQDGMLTIELPKKSAGTKEHEAIKIELS